MSLLFQRQEQMDFDDLYFYTDTIIGFSHLLADDNLKIIVINSLKYLVDNELINIYGYVIMPNHIHLIWKVLKNNGKESPVSSFTKFTAHQFKKYLRDGNQDVLGKFSSDKVDRNYQFWKRDPLAIPLTTDDILIQKLDYIHDNPSKKKWNLCAYPEDYRWSSAQFYNSGSDEFGFLTNFRD